MLSTSTKVLFGLGSLQFNRMILRALGYLRTGARLRGLIAHKEQIGTCALADIIGKGHQSKSWVLMEPAPPQTARAGERRTAMSGSPSVKRSKLLSHETVCMGDGWACVRTWVDVGSVHVYIQSESYSYMCDYVCMTYTPCVCRWEGNKNKKHIQSIDINKPSF